MVLSAKANPHNIRIHERLSRPSRYSWIIWIMASNGNNMNPINLQQNLTQQQIQVNTQHQNLASQTTSGEVERDIYQLVAQLTIPEQVYFTCYFSYDIIETDIVSVKMPYWIWVNSKKSFLILLQYYGIHLELCRCCYKKS